MLILASSSPRRKQLLKECDIEHKIHHPTYEEIVDEKHSPEDNAMEFARGKAKDVAQYFPQQWVLGVDTLVAFQHHIIGKPKDRADAKRIIQMLQGNKVEVISGIALVNESKKKEIVEYESSMVIFDAMTDKQIEGFLDTDEWKDKSGAFTIQRHGAFFIKGIEGDYYNIVGLPIFRLGKMMETAGLR